MSLNIRSVETLLEVFDMHESVAFYCNVLEFSVSGTPTDPFYFATLELGDVRLMLNAAYEDDERPPSPDPGRIASHADTILYFWCDNADEVYAHLRDKGWDAQEPSTAYYGMRQVYTKDPDGYQLCFQHPVDQLA